MAAAARARCRARVHRPHDAPTIRGPAGTFGLSIRFGSIVHTPLGCRLLAAETSKSNHRGGPGGGALSRNR